MPRVFRGLTLFCLAAVTLAVPLHAQVSGIGYRLSPSGGYVFYEGDAALNDALVYGGSLGLSFGEFVELGGLYLTGNTETDFSNLSDVDDPALAGAFAALTPRDVRVERYGGELKLNLATGGLAPFLTGGAGIVRFNPDGLEATRSIFLSGGAGLQLTGADRFGITIQGGVLGYRLDPARAFLSTGDLASLGLTRADFRATDVLNPTARVAAQVYLGGRRPGQLSDVDRAYLAQFGSGLRGVSLTLTPSVGRLDFSDDAPFVDQTFVGGELGIDLGPLVGLRAFYARGVDSSDPTDFEDIQMIGGLGRFRLASGDGFLPFATLGGGYLDVLSGYPTAVTFPGGPGAAAPESRPFALGGLGLEVPVASRFRLSGEARVIAFSNQDAEDVSEPDDVILNPMYRAGVSFALGGSRGARPDVVRREDAMAERERLRMEMDSIRSAERDMLLAEREALLVAERQRLAAERDALVDSLRAEREAFEAETQERLTALRAEIARAEASGDSARADVLRGEERVAAAEADAERARLDGAARAELRDADRRATALRRDSVRLRAPEAAAPETRTITIPVPAEGEIYIRYGRPGSAPGPGGIEVVPAQNVQASGAAPDAAPTTEDELRALVREAIADAMAEETAASGGAPGAAPGTAEADARVARLEARIDALLTERLSQDRSSALDAALYARLEERLSAEVDDLRDELRARDRAAARVTPIAPGTTAITPEAGGPVVLTPSAEVRQSGLYGVGPVIGFSVGDGPETAVVGVRAEYGAGRSVRYHPSILVGVGGGRSAFAANLDAAFDLTRPLALGRTSEAAPYGLLGVGVLRFGEGDDADQDAETRLAFNVGLGANLSLGGGRLFAEATTANFGAVNRLTAGYRFILR